MMYNISPVDLAHSLRFQTYGVQVPDGLEYHIDDLRRTASNNGDVEVVSHNTSDYKNA
ncbi:hypothetical protein KDA_47740 [Dictyobacter alpinus]|uniref:Uncharacterized protein n=1 Tax=Dictyobacter alpinus TaxID=2014873 RepID=A0A402BDA1_9CHLR|nr:hypothetical protein KDA_47740 [Dictyobacter alpinus]